MRIIKMRIPLREIEAAPKEQNQWLARAAVKFLKKEFRQFVWVLTESRYANKDFSSKSNTVNLN